MCWYSNIWIVEYSNFEVLKYLNVQIFEYLLNIEMLLEDALPHWQLARGCTLRAEPVGWECVWKQQQQQSESIVILIVNNNVRMLSKTTTINASFFTYLFVNSGGIFHLLWVDHSGSECSFSFQISFAQGSGVWSNLEFEVAVWLFLGLKEKKKIHLKKHLTSPGIPEVSQQISFKTEPLPKSNPKDKGQFQTTTPPPTRRTPVSRGVENWHLENKFEFCIILLFGTARVVQHYAIQALLP